MKELEMIESALASLAASPLGDEMASMLHATDHEDGDDEEQDDEERDDEGEDSGKEGAEWD